MTTADDVRSQLVAVKEARTTADEAARLLRRTIREAYNSGVRVAEIAEAAEMSRERVYQIRDGRR